MYKAHCQNIYGGPYKALLEAFRDSGGKGGLGLRDHRCLNMVGGESVTRQVLALFVKNELVYNPFYASTLVTLNELFGLACTIELNFTHNSFEC